jgi:hypothetical protein
MMTNGPARQHKIRKFWANKLSLRIDAVDELAQRGFFTLGSSSPPQMLVAACSLSLARKPFHQVLQELNIYKDESTSGPFTGRCFSEVDQTIRELERSGLRSQSRDLRKLGTAAAAMVNNSEWQERWAGDTGLRQIAAIHDEPFLPQQS